jgi:hypothetical protein
MLGTLLNSYKFFLKKSIINLKNQPNKKSLQVAIYFLQHFERETPPSLNTTSLRDESIDIKIDLFDGRIWLITLFLSPLLFSSYSFFPFKFQGLKDKL